MEGEEHDLGGCRNRIITADVLNVALANRSGLHYNPAARKNSGRGSARLERTVRVREVPGSNPGAPTPFLFDNSTQEHYHMMGRGFPREGDFFILHWDSIYRHL
jgi:hypothetical protein